MFSECSFFSLLFQHNSFQLEKSVSLNGVLFVQIRILFSVTACIIDSKTSSALSISVSEIEIWGFFCHDSCLDSNNRLAFPKMLKNAA